MGQKQRGGLGPVRMLMLKLNERDRYDSIEIEVERREHHLPVREFVLHQHPD